MARPKGSKNKKNIMTASQIDTQITRQQELKAKLEEEITTIQAELDKQKQLMKDKKKEIKAAEKQIASLETAKAEAEAIEAAVAQKAEIEKVVTALISNGKSADEILSLLNSNQ
ncbi:MAG: hypothetical protein LJU34_08415 [Oscillospiraceae bacterium]|nr:hypothetical protein [Oscillospiraceae bacterium]